MRLSGKFGLKDDRMKVFIDTNILFSASLFPSSIVAAAYCKAVLPPNRGYTSDYVIEELNRAYRRKAPKKMEALAEFLSEALSELVVLHTPKELLAEECLVRDPNDHPVLRAAMVERVDILLTGDKDLLESCVTKLEIMSPAEFLKQRF